MSEAGDIPPDAVLDLLTSLVDKSLVQVEPATGGAVRYRMLETLRQYADGRLGANGESDAVRRQHSAHFLELAEQADKELRGRSQVKWLDRVEVEHDNLRSALRWGVEREQADQGLRLGAALVGFWLMHSHLSEGRRTAHGGVGSQDG